MPTPRIRVADGVEAGDGAPLLIIAGPDVIESEDHALGMARRLRSIADERGVPLVFKASFDKANRTSIESYRGPGLDGGQHLKFEASFGFAMIERLVFGQWAERMRGSVIGPPTRTHGHSEIHAVVGHLVL